MRHEFASEVRLAGGFHCMLKPSEKNEWFEFAIETDVWKRFEAAELAIDAANLSGAMTHAQAVAAVEEREDARRQMYRLGKAWYADLMKREAVAESETRAAGMDG
jgi:hypothetical protein